MSIELKEVSAEDMKNAEEKATQTPHIDAADLDDDDLDIEEIDIDDDLL
jgi:hypothetical protein